MKFKNSFRPETASYNKNTLVLATSQALFTAIISIDMTLTGLTGYQLAPEKSLATLPFALIIVSGAVMTIPSSMIMRRTGRRKGFALGSVIGAIGGLISVWSVFHENFWLFCAGTAGVGAFQAFAQYYRLAAADSVGPDLKAKAISNVLVGGVVAAVAGPALASWSTDLFAVRFAGSYMMVSILSAISALLILTAYHDTEDNAPQRRDFPTPVRPLSKIMLQPVSLAAIANNVIGGAMMMLVMTATPLAAVTCGHDISEGANIIQWHMVGMYVPSLFAGKLIGYLGLPTIIFTGIGLSMACGLIASASPDSFYLALLCLGVGWNFMFVGGTTLLAQSYRPEEKDRTQGAAELLRYSVTALAALGAGSMFENFGWTYLNMSILPMGMIAALLTLHWMRSRKQG
jgi:predicted MFS family arabinose efflux permease